MAQVDDAQFFALLDADANSIALIVKHVAGNMRSRWTDFLTSDGEKPDRDRDSEFEREPADTREAILARWEAGWELLFDAVTSLQPGDLGRPSRSAASRTRSCRRSTGSCHTTRPTSGRSCCSRNTSRGRTGRR